MTILEMKLENVTVEQATKLLKESILPKLDATLKRNQELNQRAERLAKNTEALNETISLPNS